MKSPPHSWPRWLPWLIVALALAYYLVGIGRWMGYDDEGGYFYAAWRIGQGEMPYRDFLSPQLPFFLYPGALALELLGTWAVGLRILSAIAVAWSGLLLARTVERLPGGSPFAGVLAMVLYLLQHDVFWAARFFRAEAPMLLYSMAGLYWFVASWPTRRRGLALAGLFFGLATATRLFGFLPFAGVCFFLAYDASAAALANRAQGLRELRRAAGRALWLLVPFAVVVGGIFGVMYLLTDNFFAAILGHHLKQGATLSHGQVLLKGLRLFGQYGLHNAALVLGAALAIVPALRRGHGSGSAPDPAARLRSLFVWQLPTALAFLVLSRDLGERHMVHLVPSLAALFGLAGAALMREWTASARPAERPSVPPPWGAGDWRRRWMAAPVLSLVALLAIVPSLLANRQVASWREQSTALIASYIQSLTGPDEYVLCDYPGLNFHARRKNTRTGAGLSRGATEGGQILGADLIREIEANNVRLVIINVAQGAHQMAGLHDYEQFHSYVHTHFNLVGRAVYDYRLLEFYYADDLFPQQPRADFGGALRLTGFSLGDRLMDLTDPARPPGTTRVEAGTDWVVTLRWQALARMDKDYYVVLRVVDEKGHEWGLGQRQLLTEGREVYYDAKGLPQPVLHPTHEWAVGESAMDFFKAPVLVGTPPGTYQVIARLRTLDEWNGLPVTRGDESFGLDYPLGTITVTRPAAPPPVAALGAMAPLDKELGALDLLGYAPTEMRVRPGDALDVTIFWRALRNITDDWQIALRLEAHDGQELAEATLDLARGYPTHQWSEGELVRGQYRLPTSPAGLESAGIGRLVLHGVDRKTGRAFPRDGIVIAPVTIEAFERIFAPPPDIQHPLNASFEDQITLLGYSLGNATLRAGGTVHLTLYWQAQQRMNRSYTVFTHLMGGGMWGQKDHVPVEGRHPTSGWLAGEVVVDKIDIAVKASAPPGDYAIELGLYELATGKRLLVTLPGGPTADALTVPGVRVQ